MTRASLRPQAEVDLIDQTASYRSHGGEDLARRYFDHAIRAVRAIERNPGAGSPYAGEVADIPGLRSWPVRGFPARWYYVNPGLSGLDIVRLLVDGRDVAPSLVPGGPSEGRPR